jgi:cytochrome c oxidase subunit IV
MSNPSVHTLRLYLLVWVALMVLVALTVASSYVKLGSFNLAVSMAISAAKTALVMTLYMELRREQGTVIVFAITGFCWLALMIAPTVADIATR